MDWMRGLAALWVVFFHLNEPIPFVPSLYADFCKLGWLGVPAFFSISGWCMYSLAMRATGPLVFLRARFLRIYPPYLASIFFVLFSLFVVKLLTGFNDSAVLPKTPGALLATLMMATSPVTDVPAINWVYWSLSVEFAFYILVAIVIFCSLARGAVVAEMLMLVVLGGATFVNFLGLPMEGTPLFWLPSFPLFAIGWYGHALLLGGVVSRQGLWLMFAAVAVVVTGQGTDGRAWLALAVSCLCLMLLMRADNSLCRAVGRSRLGAVLSRLGAISYSIYLIHVPLGCYLIGKLRSGAILSSLPMHVLFDAASVIVIVGVSTIFYRWIELPSHRWAKSSAVRPRVA